MSRKRGSRGGGADLYAARQTEAIVPTVEDETDPIEIIAEETGEIIEDDPAEEPDDAGDEHEDDEGDDAALTTMQRQLAALTAERDAAIRQRDDAVGETVVSQQAILQQALTSAKQRAEDAEAEIAQASAAADHVGVARATAKLSKAIQDQDRFELAVDEIAVELEDRKKPKPAPKPAAADGDAYVASLKPFSEPSQAWLIKHRAHIEGKPEVGEKAQAAALYATKVRGIKEDSPEFFDYLDKELGFKTVAPKRNKPAAGRPQTAAPTGQRAGNGRANEVVLTAAQRQTAVALGMSLKEYATSIREIQQNGKDPNRSGLRFSADTAHSSRR